MTMTTTYLLSCAFFAFEGQIPGRYGMYRYLPLATQHVDRVVVCVVAVKRHSTIHFTLVFDRHLSSCCNVKELFFNSPFNCHLQYCRLLDLVFLSHCFLLGGRNDILFTSIVIFCDYKYDLCTFLCVLRLRGRFLVQYVPVPTYT
jgi:hypothetical protein